MQKKKIALAGVACTAVFMFGGCYYEGSPESARARVSNLCEVPVAVSVGSNADSYPPDWDASLMPAIDPGDQQDLLEPLDFPPGNMWYVWVVVPGTELMGSPYEVPVSEVGEESTSAGSRRVVIKITGTMCPA